MSEPTTRVGKALVKLARYQDKVLTQEAERKNYVVAAIAQAKKSAYEDAIALVEADADAEETLP